VKQDEFKRRFPEAFAKYVETVLVDAQEVDEYFVAYDGSPSYIHNDGRSVTELVFRNNRWQESENDYGEEE
jgi:hypothetical protein